MIENPLIPFSEDVGLYDDNTREGGLISSPKFLRGNIVFCKIFLKRLRLLFYLFYIFHS